MKVKDIMMSMKAWDISLAMNNLNSQPVPGIINRQLDQGTPMNSLVIIYKASQLLALHIIWVHHDPGSNQMTQEMSPASECPMN